ncbi:MAG: hypothetical protein D6744_07535 [Planctomycetota bacterium]|nr:MAG: hypothetical protein D6744_07535 [Planctomycetota bacterium]
MLNARPIRYTICAAVLAALFAAGGCPQTTTPNGDGALGQGKLVRFKSADEFLNYFRDRARARISRRPFRMLRNLFGAPLAAAAGGAETATADTAADDVGGGDAFTTTNIQEAGVDESDVFKSDGEYFYVAQHDTIRIVHAAPSAALEEVGSITLDEPVDEFYLFGDKLIALSNSYARNMPGFVEIAIWPPYALHSNTIAHEIDISDPANPVLLQSVEFDGSLVTSRLTGERLILVLTIAPELPDTPIEIGLLSMDDVMPKMRVGQSTRDIAEWSDWFHPENPDGYFMTVVVTLDAADISTTVGSSAIMANAGTIYASTEALYVTDADYDVNDSLRPMTTIHKFSIGDQGAAYAATGEVPGRLLNQFSLGEKDGNLRVATHVRQEIFFGFDDVVGIGTGTGVAVADASPPDAINAQSIDPNLPPTPYNAVYVLSQNGETLDVIGSVENIAPGEQLFSARFIGDRGYLVTFVQVDPLFVVDLTDPTAPRIAGELKIPGFSDYLHPFRENYLIGVGKATRISDFGGVVTDGLQISLFDVSDPANPTAVQQITVGDAGSSADVSYDHKAFALLADEGLLALPASVYTQLSPSSFEFERFEGVLAYQIDPATGFTPLRQLEMVTDAHGFWYGWRRAAFIGNTLYAISPQGVSRAPIDALDSPEELSFPPVDFFGDEVPFDEGGFAGEPIR